MTRVLVVDDTATIREVLVDSLTKVGYEVAEAPDGETALEIASREPINIILLDVQIRRWTASRCCADSGRPQI
jgi:CheY-like chemotaxis protein